MIFVYDMSVQVVRTNTNKINNIVKATVKIQIYFEKKISILYSGR